MNVCGTPGGAHDEYRPVSSAPRTTRYFSAPGFNVGVRGSEPGVGAGAAAGAPAPRPPGAAPYPYTPVRSGLPSAVLGAGCFVMSTAVPGSVMAAATVPATVTVAVFVNVPLVPVTVSVYVVVAVGVTLRTPRGAARPTVGEIVVDRGFSTAHVSVAD